MTFPAIAANGCAQAIVANGCAIIHAARRTRPADEVEADGFITAHPAPTPHPGGRPEDFDIEAIDALVESLDPDDHTETFHDPIWRAASEHGTYWWTAIDGTRCKALALHGLTAYAATDSAVADEWIKAAAIALVGNGIAEQMCREFTSC